MEQERVTGSRRVYEGKRLHVRADDIAFEDGRTGIREVVEYGPAVVIVPITEANELIMVRQYRRAVDQTLIELPAGGIHGDEAPEAAAHRELREETGLRASVMHSLGGFYAAPGYTDEYLHLFLAEELVQDPLNPDEDESIDVVIVSLDDAIDLIVNGEIRDAKSVAGILRVMVYLNESGYGALI